MDKKQTVHLKRGQLGTKLQKGFFPTTNCKGKRKKPNYIAQKIFIACGSVTSENTEICLKCCGYKNMGWLLAGNVFEMHERGYVRCHPGEPN